MGLQFKRCGGDVCVALGGELDEYSARSLKAQVDALIEARGFKAMIFDMKGVTFMDSTGLGFVLGRYKKLKASNMELILKNIPPAVDRVFRASGVYSFIPVDED